MAEKEKIVVTEADKKLGEVILKGVEKGNAKCMRMYAQALQERNKKEDIKSLEDIRLEKQLKGLTFYNTVRDIAEKTVKTEKPMFDFISSVEESPQTLCDYAINEMGDNQEHIDATIKSLKIHADTFSKLAEGLENSLTKRRNKE